MRRWMSRGAFALAFILATVPQSAAAQDDVLHGDSMTNAGIKRASAAVDSVFVDRLIPAASVSGGDFASYLMARLGVIPIPPDLGFLVTVDTQRILLHGRVEDLPWAARRALGTMLAMFPPGSRVIAEITLQRASLAAVRFHLRKVTINGQSVPEPLLAVVMGNIGAQYKALTSTGRDLFVEIPVNSRVALGTNAVQLEGPPKGRGPGD